MNVIQQQLDISKSLLTALDSLISMYENNNISTGQQSVNMSNVVKVIAESNENLSSVDSDSQSMSRSIVSSAKNNLKENKINSTSNKLSEDIKKGIETSSKSNSKTERSVKNTSKEMLGARSILSKNGLSDITKDLNASMSKVNKNILNTIKTINVSKKMVGFLRKIVGLIIIAKDALLSGGLTLIKDIPSMLWGLMKTAFNIVTSVIGAMSKLVIFSTTLPFSIAKFAVSVGNTIRTELVETIQAAGEEAKDSFDLTSNIGKNADKMTQVSKGMLKQFESPRTRLSKLFGMGASGAATFLRETFKATAEMGHYAEIFGPSILGNTKTGQYLIEMQRAMGLGAQEMAYYALQAYNAGKHPIDTLYETSQIIKSVADTNDLDFKALTKEFHKLRTNIIEFGHLSSTEIGNLVGKLRKMKIKTEDAVNVFKKFTSFEEASKAGAMLFQSFNMNIDAFDLLTARDPGAMLQQFRDAMFQTGRSFKDLNRHEKALMSSITGIGEHGLSTLMNYMDLGLTQDEARKRMEEQDPTKEQAKMIKGLTSTIKLVQKTMTFKSPFEAFFKGLSDNAANQKTLQEGMISLSKLYDDIYHLGWSLNLSKVDSLLKPLTKILKNIDNLINGDKFKSILSHATSTAGKFLSHFSYDLETDPSKLVGVKKYSLQERIDELYNDLSKMLDDGSPILGKFVIMGGKIMGGILKGAIKGVTAAFHLLAGGIGKTVESLGITMTDKMKADARKKGYKGDFKNYTILDWLGITQGDADSLQQSLNSAIIGLVKKLPTVVSMASTIIEDLTEVLMQFAGSLLGILGSMTIEYYDNSNFVTKGLLKSVGFNVESARAAASGIASGDSLSMDLGDIIGKTHVKGKLKEGYIGTYISYIEDLQKSFPKGSPPHNFLNDPKTAENINYIKNTGNFKIKSLGDSIDDAEEPQRAQAIFKIAESAYRVNSHLPYEVFNLFKGKKDKPKWYEKSESIANKTGKSMTANLIKGPNIDSHYSSDADTVFNSANNVINAEGLAINTLKSLIDSKKIISKKGRLSIPTKVQDIEYPGKNTILVTPNANYYLDDHDAVLAAKKGGFLNKLFIGFTSHFNNVTETNLKMYNKKIDELVENIADPSRSAVMLSDYKLDRNNLDMPADEEDILNLFHIFENLISTINNKEITAKNIKPIFNV